MTNYVLISEVLLSRLVADGSVSESALDAIAKSTSWLTPNGQEYTVKNIRKRLEVSN